MRFLMVDRIYELNSGKSAKGVKNISWDDDFLEEVFPGIPVFSSVIAAEAAAQLVSWIIMEAGDFTLKPVITLVDSYACSGQIMPGDQLELQGEIESFSGESALAHGKALINGHPVVELNHAVCYLYPLEKLDPPDRARMRFRNLYDEGYALSAGKTFHQPQAVQEGKASGKRKTVDMILSCDEPERMQGIKNVTATQDYFNDHFPLMPVLPGVVIIESMVDLSKMLLERVLAGRSMKRPLLSHINKIKFRKSVRPGDQLLVDAKLKNFSLEKSAVTVRAMVSGKNVATATVELELFDEEEYRAKFFKSRN